MGHMTHTGKRRDIHTGFWWETCLEKATSRSCLRYEDNITMACKEIQWEGVEWVHAPQHREKWCDLMKTVINFQAP
jgi:hypothetical protein